MNTLQNRRILLVDDMPAIHEDYRKILVETGSDPDLGGDEEFLFGDKPRAYRASFEFESAYQGPEAIKRVRSALDAGCPYAMAFVDMRMPPGWDGVETIEKLWQEDPELQIVLCTAYSDYSWTEVLGRLDVRDRMLVLKKPFDAVEVYQFASALTRKWTLTRQAAFKMSSLEQAVEERTRELSDANIIVQNSPVVLYRLRGEPSFPLIYISHNVTKFGHDRARLLDSTDWAANLVHADDRAEIRAAMARVLESDSDGASIEFRLRTGDGNYRWVENRYVPVRDREGRLVEIEGMIIDITERKAAEEKIALLARTDSLTGLPNRATFMERLRHSFAAMQRGARPFAIFYLDLDRFKPVNDTLGHAVGDLLLRDVAERLRSCTRETDVVARLGGDEFAVLQSDMIEPVSAATLAAKLQSVLATPYYLNGNEVHISVSIGICPYVKGSVSADAMLVQADMALYRSKSEGRNQFHFHCDDLDQEIIDRTALANDLKTAIEHRELELYYQPQIELSSGAIVGMEALLRWNHPTRGLLPAATFVPIAEKTGTILALGRWALDQACGQMHVWRAEGLALPVIAVNLSVFQLKAGTAIIRDVADTIAKWQLSPEDVEFDVTEATLAQVTSMETDVLTQLRELGVKIAIDDFGSKYSSFEYVSAYRVNHLKIAQTFIKRSIDDPKCAATIRAIVALARELGIGIIAQGVETEQQRALLAETDSATQAQGFHFSAAVRAEAAGQLLRADASIAGAAKSPTAIHLRGRAA